MKYSSNKEYNSGSLLYEADYFFRVSCARYSRQKPQIGTALRRSGLGEDPRCSSPLLFGDWPGRVTDSTHGWAPSFEAYGEYVRCPVCGPGSRGSVLDVLLWRGIRSFGEKILSFECLFDDEVSKSHRRQGICEDRGHHSNAAFGEEENRSQSDGNRLFVHGEECRISDRLKPLGQRSAESSEGNRKVERAGGKGSQGLKKLPTPIEENSHYHDEARKRSDGQNQERNFGIIQSGGSRNSEVQSDDTPSGTFSEKGGMRSHDTSCGRGMDFIPEAAGETTGARGLSGAGKIQGKTYSQESLQSSRTRSDVDSEREKIEAQRVREQIQYFHRPQWFYRQPRELFHEQARFGASGSRPQELGGENGTPSLANECRSRIRAEEICYVPPGKEHQEALHTDKGEEKASGPQKTVVQKGTVHAGRNRSGDRAPQTRPPLRPISRSWISRRQDKSLSRMPSMESQQAGKGGIEQKWKSTGPPLGKPATG